MVTVRATCLRSVKADGKEPPAALGVVVSSPTGKDPHDRVLRTPRQEENGRHSRWPGAASSSLVSRSRACRPEAGPILPVGAPSRPCHGTVGFCALSPVGGTCRDGSHPGDLGSSPPRPCGPLCRPEAGVPSRPRHCAIGYTRSHAHPSPRCGKSGPSCDGEYEKYGLAACGQSGVRAESGQSSRWGRGPRLTRRAREEPPPGETIMIGSSRTPRLASKKGAAAGRVSGRGIRDWKRVRNSSWQSAVSSALVSRSRAMPTGGRRSLASVPLGRVG